MADEVGIQVQVQNPPRHDPINEDGNEIPIQDRKSRKQAVTVVHLANRWIRWELGCESGLDVGNKSKSMKKKHILILVVLIVSSLITPVFVQWYEQNTGIIPYGFIALSLMTGTISTYYIVVDIFNNES